MRSLTDHNSLFDVYKSLFDFNHDACYALDLEGNFTLFNQAAVEITGYTVEEALQMSFITVILEEDLEKTIYLFNNVIQGNRARFEISIKNKMGNIVDLSITAVPIYVGKQIYGIVGMANDITRKNNLEELLNGQNKVLEMVAKGSPFQDVLDNIISIVENVSHEGVCSIHLVDQDKMNLICCSSPNLPIEYCEQINVIPINTIVACSPDSYFQHPVHVSDIEKDPLWYPNKDAALKNGLRGCWSSFIFDMQQNVLGVFSIYFDKPCSPTEWDLEILEKAAYTTSLVIQHYRAEERINFMAFHDDLTGLPNRRLFDLRVTEAINRGQKEKGQMLGILYVDLDQFKLINDSLGHNIGDMLLKDVANRLLICIRDTDTASRQGGDEFIILFDNVTKDEITTIAQKIVDVVSQPFTIEGHEIFVTPSIGISLYPLDGINTNELLRKADVAMYHAKKKGRNNFQFYDEILEKKTIDRLGIENELRKALDKDEFTLHYQPIINLATNKISGVEALLRWHNPQLGIVSPEQFIPIAEETGMIVSIGEWVMKTACGLLKDWERDGIKLPSIAVNISIRQFYQPNLISMIESIFNEKSINPKNITIEITESMTMDVHTASTILHELKRLGVNISIDDFGTGYSSLSYLKTFPIDYLKIDKSFIQDIENSRDDENIATTILLMARNLGLSVIAEGVETNEQLKFLQNHNCNKAQGYLFSKPLHADELKQFLICDQCYV